MSFSQLVVGCLLLVAVFCRVQGHSVVQEPALPRDCADIYESGKRVSGVYLIRPHGQAAPFQVYCEFTRMEGWTVIMYRYDGSENFNRSWVDYREGFGDVSGEYWLGNEHIYQLTKRKHYKMRIDYKYWFESNAYTADYIGFRVYSEHFQYKMNYLDYKGCSSDYDGLSYYKGRPFSTFDQDNDRSIGNCAQNTGGGFWFYGYANLGNCHRYGNPTGLYQAECSKYQCMQWAEQPTKMMIMKIAPSL